MSLSDNTLEGVDAEEAKFEDFSLFYAPEKGGYLVGDYKGSLTSFAVPEQATGEDGVTAPVVGLADYAFYGRKEITTVLLGENISYLGAHCFADTGITDLRVAGSLTHVDDDAFTGSKITFYKKDGVEYLPSWDYPYSTAFTTKGAHYKGTIGEQTYGAPLLDSSCFHAIIKPGTTEIEEGAFAGGCSLISVVIPSSVTSIGHYAFRGCSCLTSIDIPSSVTSIGHYAFRGCSSLTSFDIPSSVTSIGNGAFDYCPSLTSIVIPSSVTSIGDNTFYDCSGLTSVQIGEEVTSIGKSAFYGCSSLTSIDIPSSVTSIGDDAFTNCSSLVLFVNRSSLDLSRFNRYVAVLDDEAEYSLSTDKDGFMILSTGEDPPQLQRGR